MVQNIIIIIILFRSLHCYSHCCYIVHDIVCCIVHNTVCVIFYCQLYCLETYVGLLFIILFNILFWNMTCIFLRCYNIVISHNMMHQYCLVSFNWFIVYQSVIIIIWFNFLYIIFWIDLLSSGHWRRCIYHWDTCPSNIVTIFVFGTETKTEVVENLIYPPNRGTAT